MGLRTAVGPQVVDVAAGPWGEATATFSACRRWRYEATRTWDAARGVVAFVMLNPSTTDAVTIDPTVRRCLGFATRWGFGAVVVTNCFAWRSTDPRALRRVDDPIGPDNDAALLAAARRADLVVAAWGVHGVLGDRGARVRDLLHRAGVPLRVLGLTSGGHPAHPLYLPAARAPVPWWAAEGLQPG